MGRRMEVTACFPAPSGNYCLCVYIQEHLLTHVLGWWIIPKQFALIRANTGYRGIWYFPWSYYCLMTTTRYGRWDSGVFWFTYGQNRQNSKSLVAHFAHAHLHIPECLSPWLLFYHSNIGSFGFWLFLLKYVFFFPVDCDWVAEKATQENWDVSNKESKQGFVF